jgi:uncharacterized protein (TIGR02444 family)
LERIELDQERRRVKLSPHELEADSWAFALDIYAKPGVADACLKLQDRAGVDVMIFFMVAYAAVRHRILLTPAEIGRLDEACRPWREQIVRPLRTIRSALKTGPLPAPSSETEQFRTKVKTVELAAERLQNQLLAECLRPELAPKDVVSAEGLRGVLGNAVTLFLDRGEKRPQAELFSSIDTIVDAAMEMAH